MTAKSFTLFGRIALTLSVALGLGSAAHAQAPSKSRGTLNSRSLRVENTAAAEQGMIFDGKTLEGWEGDADYFRVDKGAIVAGRGEEPIAQNEFLCTTKEYGDFELRLKVRTRTDGANGGIQFRSKRVPDEREVSGYQADVGAGWWGKLYDESRRNKVLAAPENYEEFAKNVKPTLWNDYRIRCEGNHIQLWVNGKMSVDYTETDDSIAKTGVIAVQIHGGAPAEIWYKDIQIKELDASE